MSAKLILGREPAIWLALIASLIQGISGFFFHLTDDQQGVLNAAAVAVFGLITALMVKGDQWVPFVIGLAKALLAVGISFGVHIDSAHQGIIMVIITTLFSFISRQAVTAPVPAQAIRAG